MSPTTFWAGWLIFIFVSFGLAEVYFMHTNGVPGTFSYFMTTMNAKWPMWSVLWGILIGGLSVHFWWLRSY